MTVELTEDGLCDIIFLKQTRQSICYMSMFRFFGFVHSIMMLLIKSRKRLRVFGARCNLHGAMMNTIKLGGFYYGKKQKLDT